MGRGVLIALISLWAVVWFSLVQVLYIVDKIFSTAEEKYYKKQHIPIIGIFYSLYLRKKFGVKKGFIWREIEGLGCFYNLETHEVVQGGAGKAEKKSFDDGRAV
jgi:hypothetical protein